jgi:hypothetical protein
MATSNHSTHHVIEQAVHDQTRPAWMRHFSEETRRQLMYEELHAGRTVPWLLTSLITAGVVLASTTVVLIWVFL